MLTDDLGLALSLILGLGLALALSLGQLQSLLNRCLLMP